MKKLHLRHKKTLEERLEQEVSKEVKEVKREWRELLKFKDENQLLFVAFVIVVTAAVVINAVYVINHSTNNSPSRLSGQTIILPDASRVLTSQQTGANSVETVIISAVTETDKMDYAYTIDSSQTMLIMNISITNNTNATQKLIPVNQLYVRSNEGDYAPMHPSSEIITPLAATELGPNKTAAGQISFSVPKHIAHPLLYIDTGWGNKTPLVYDVLR